MAAHDALTRSLLVVFASRPSSAEAAAEMLAKTIDDWVISRIGSSDASNLYSCAATVLVGDAVYLSSSDTVGRADATSEATSPAIGIVFTKPSSTQARVQWAGELSGFTGLSPGETYFITTTPGQISLTAPTAPNQILQRIGFARNATTLVIEVDQDFVVL